MPYGYQGISINKSAPDRIIISALEIIEPGTLVVNIATERLGDQLISRVIGAGYKNKGQ